MVGREGEGGGVKGRRGDKEWRRELRIERCKTRNKKDRREQREEEQGVPWARLEYECTTMGEFTCCEIWSRFYWKYR